jgi:hypothetical protein
MENYQTPIRPKKFRLLGMTIPQLALLAGLGVVQLVIIVLALKFIVFAPKDNVADIGTSPEAKAVETVLALKPTLTATPIPDFTTAVLTIDDLPIGFASGPDESYDIDFKVFFEGTDLHPVNRFTLYELQKDQFVVGWTFAFNTTRDREKFDIIVAHPDPLFAAYKQHWGEVDVSEQEQLEKSVPIGELSTGWKVIASGVDVDLRSDMVLFSQKNYGGIVMVLYNSKEPPVIGAWEVAQKLNNRALDVLVNGPIPTPVVIAYNDLTGVKLTQADLPAGFQAVPDADLQFDEASRSEMESGGMRVAGIFGFHYDKPNAEEFVLGFTFLFSNTIGKAVMDQMLASDELLDAMFEPTPTQKRQSLTITKPVGDRALSTAIMEMTETGGIRCDVFVFRRGYVGVVLFHIYTPGRRQITVEDLAVKMDAQIKGLASP